MNPSPSKSKTSPATALRWLATAFASYALLGSLSALVGWTLHIPRLTDWIGSGIAMFPNAALGAALVAVALLLHNRNYRWGRRVCMTCAMVAALIGGATLFEHVTGHNLGIDNLLFETTWGRAAMAPGRLGPPASLSLTFMGLSVLLMFGNARARRIVPILGLGVFALVTLAITGYAYGADRLYAIARYTGIALPTATIYLSLSLAVILKVPESEPARTLFQDCAAGMLARRTLGFIIAMPIILGWLRLIGERNGWFDGAMGAALLVLVLMAMLCALLWWCTGAVATREAAVRESERRFRTMADCTPVMIWVTNDRGEIEFVNHAYRDYFGVTAEQVRGPGGWHPLIHPEDATGYVRAYAEALRARGPFNAKCRVRHADGEWHWIASHGAPRFAEGGEFLGHVGSSPDITELKRIEGALRESETRLASELDSAKRLQRLSTHVVQRDGIDALYEEIIDTAVALMHSDFASMQRFYPERGASGELHLLTHRGFTPEAARGWARVAKDSPTVCAAALKSGRRVIVEDIREEKTIPADSVAAFEQVGIRSVQSTLLFSRSGEMLGIISTHWRRPHRPDADEFRVFDVLARLAADLMDRALAEESLRQAQHRLEVALRASGGVPWGWEVAENRMDNWTPEYRKLYGIAPETPATFENWLSRIHADDRQRLIARSLQISNTPGDDIWNEEFRIAHPQQGERWIGGVGRAFRDENGRVTRMTGVNLDITERKHTEEALRLAHEQLANRAVHLESLVHERTAKLQDMVYELEHVSYAITHDMRAPLRAMSAFASLLLENENAGGNRGGIEYCQRIISAANRLDKLIQDSLHYTKTVLQEMPLQPVDLNGLINDLLATYPNLQSDRADIRIEGDLPLVLGNEALLTQCFSNLLGNAVKFVPRGTHPRVRIRTEGGVEVAKIWIEDNGIGIPAHGQDRLFKMFQRLTNDYEGSGVGLAIVRKVVERMGGRVGVESAAGEGSRFWLELRVAAESTDLKHPSRVNTPQPAQFQTA